MRLYAPPLRESYFEEARKHQTDFQNKIFEKFEKNERLPYELATATHLHASRFFEEVGDKFGTACKPACSYCCHQPATAFPFEAIQLARVLKESLSPEQLEALTLKLKSRVSGLKGSSTRKNVNNKTACPLLVDDRCSVYDNRPMTCRMAHSFSVKRCRLSFEKDRYKVELPISLGFLSGISGIIEGAFEELPKRKLDGNLYELCSALLAALADPKAASKWARGDRGVFKDCVKDDT